MPSWDFCSLLEDLSCWLAVSSESRNCFFLWIVSIQPRAWHRVGIFLKCWIHKWKICDFYREICSEKFSNLSKLRNIVRIFEVWRFFEICVLFTTRYVTSQRKSHMWKIEFQLLFQFLSENCTLIGLPPELDMPKPLFSMEEDYSSRVERLSLAWPPRYACSRRLPPGSTDRGVGPTP